MFNQSLAVGWGSVRQIWVCLVVRVASGRLIRVGTQVREGNLAWVSRVIVRYGRYQVRVACSFPAYGSVNIYSVYLSNLA